MKTQGIAVPPGEVAENPGEAVAIAEKIGCPVAVKAQVHAGGRGKAGGIKLANSSEEARKAAEQILGMTIKGFSVRKVLVEACADIDREFYAGIVIDRVQNLPVFMISGAGGVDIEEVAAKTPEAILKLAIRPALGVMPHHIRRTSAFLGLDREIQKDFGRVLSKLFALFVEKDSSLTEINPLVLTKQKEWIALDGKINFDDNALFRHPDIEELRDRGEEEPLETEAKDKGLNYVKLDGNIGCIVNGAGLAMATMDVLQVYGGRPANFLDVGGGARAEQVADALRIVTKDESVKTVFFNIFGGIVRCDRVAEGILQALGQLDLKIPIVIRLTGNNEDKAREMLKETDLIACATMPEGAQKAVEVAA